MTEINEMIPDHQPVSTVTKHIKIYSDNPIHDCIDRIIDICDLVDENNEYLMIYLSELELAARELYIRAELAQVDYQKQLDKETYAKKRN